MPGPVPGIHVLGAVGKEDVDGRDRPGPDEHERITGRFGDCDSRHFSRAVFFPAAEQIRPVSDWIAGNGGMAAMSRSARGSEGGIDVRMISCALAALAVVLGSGAAAAQSVNLTGKFVCVVHCRQGLQGNPAFITQNGEQIDLVNETGQPARAWPDWTAPASRIWVDAWEEGAVYSPDGMTLQFDDGTIWQRDLGPPPPPPVLIVPRRTRG